MTSFSVKCKDYLLNLEVANSSSFRDIKKHFVTSAAAAADIDDSIKRKGFRVSLKSHLNMKERYYVGI